jgi:AraC-like DNA-binding protein
MKTGTGDRDPRTGESASTAGVDLQFSVDELRSFPADEAAQAAGHRLLLVIGGALRLRLPGAERTVLAGALLFVPERAELSLQRSAGAAVRRMRFGRGLLDPLSLAGVGDEILQMLNGSRIRVARLAAAGFQEARSLFSLLEQEADERKPGYRAMLRVKLQELLLLLYRTENAGAGSGAGSVRFRIEDARAYIEEHYADDLSLSRLAARYGLNPSYFSRVFREQAGTPLFEHINGIRIAKSCQLLKRSQIDIVEIAYAVGYNNLSHFNRYFRKIVGMSPREYRKLSQK